MDSDLVEWTEIISKDQYDELNNLYDKYKKVTTNEVLEQKDFNGYFYIVCTYYWYINEVENGNISESEKVPLSKARKSFLEAKDKINLEKILS